MLLELALILWRVVVLTPTEEKKRQLKEKWLRDKERMTETNRGLKEKRESLKQGNLPLIVAAVVVVAVVIVKKTEGREEPRENPSLDHMINQEGKREENTIEKRIEVVTEKNQAPDERGMTELKSKKRMRRVLLGSNGRLTNEPDILKSKKNRIHLLEDTWQTEERILEEKFAEKEGVEVLR